MKTKLIILLLIVTSGLYAQKQDVYRNQEFGFRITFEGEMKTINKLIPVNDQNVEMNMFLVDNSANSSATNLLYSVAHAAYNKEEYLVEDSERDDLVLNSAVDGAKNNVKGNIIFNKDFTLNGFPGKQAKIKIQGAYIYINLILVKHELYFTQVICTLENDENDDIDRFFESFDLIKTKKRL